MFRPPSIATRTCLLSSLKSVRPPILLYSPPIVQKTRGIAIYQPRSVRSRKSHKGSFPCRTGGSTKGTTLQYGDYGLRVIRESRELSDTQLQTADAVLKKAVKDVKGIRIYYRFACGKPVCKKGNEVRMGKGKGSFDHWGTVVPAGKMLFEISAPELRTEIAREALEAAGRAIPGPVQVVNKAKLKEPAIVGLSRVPVFHAGVKVEGPVDRKIRTATIPEAVVSLQAGYEKREKLRKGMVRR